MFAGAVRSMRGPIEFSKTKLLMGLYPILEDKDLLNAIGGEVGLPWLALTAWPLFTHGVMREQSLRLSGVSEALMHNGSFWTQTQDQMKTPLPSVEVGALKDPGF